MPWPWQAAGGGAPEQTSARVETPPLGAGQKAHKSPQKAGDGDAAHLPPRPRRSRHARSRPPRAHRPAPPARRPGGTAGRGRSRNQTAAMLRAVVALSAIVLQCSVICWQLVGLPTRTVPRSVISRRQPGRAVSGRRGHGLCPGVAPAPRTVQPSTGAPAASIRSPNDTSACAARSGVRDRPNAPRGVGTPLQEGGGREGRPAPRATPRLLVNRSGALGCGDAAICRVRQGRPETQNT